MSEESGGRLVTFAGMSLMLVWCAVVSVLDQLKLPPTSVVLGEELEKFTSLI